MKKIFNQNSFKFFKCKICWQITVSLLAIMLVLEVIFFFPFYFQFKNQQLKQFELRQIHAIQILISALQKPNTNSNFLKKILTDSNFSGLNIYSPSGIKIKSLGTAPNITPFQSMKLKSIQSSFYKKDANHFYAFWDQNDLKSPYEVIAVVDARQVKTSLKDFFIQYIDKAIIFLLATFLGSVAVIYFWLIRPIRRTYSALYQAKKHRPSFLLPLPDIPKNELGYIFRSLNDSFSKLAKIIFKLKEKNKLIQKMNQNLDDKIKRRTQELELANQVLHSTALLPEENNSPIFRIAADGKIIYANRASQILFDFWECGNEPKVPPTWVKLIPAILEKNLNKKIEVRLENATYLLDLVPIKDESYVNVYGLDITEQKRAEETNKFLKSHDPVTGCYNKSALKLIIEDRISENATDLSFNLFFLQVNDIAEINQNLGHYVGDAFLAKIASYIKKNIPAHYTVSYFSENIFALVTFAKENLLNADFFALELIHLFSKPFEVEQHRLRTSVNVGIVQYPQDATTTQELFKFADMALLQAVHHDANTFHFFTEEINDQFSTRHSTYQALYEAVQNQELLLYYQPQLSLRNNKIVSAESLIRWQHPKKGLIPPSEFIDILENTALILDLTYWLFETAIKCHINLNNKQLGPIKIAVNLTAKQLYQENLLSILNELLNKYEFDPQWIEVEITERASLTEPEKAISILNQLHKLGFKIALDDFGAEYSSLTYLQTLPIDKIKLDKKFIDELSVEKNNPVITRAIIHLANELNLLTLAEGVETVEQKQMLSKFGCDEIQGYLISEPISEEDFIATLQKISET